MKNYEFQALINAQPPMILLAHKRKLFLSRLWGCLGMMFSFRAVAFMQEIILISTLLRDLQKEVEKYNITFSNEGFENLGEKFYWHQVSAFEMGKNDVIFFNANKDNVSRTAKWLLGYDTLIFNLSIVNTHQLTKLLNHWRERYLARSLAL